jgi:hypothetical protein
MLSPDFFNKFINFSKYTYGGKQVNDTLHQQNYAEMIKPEPAHITKYYFNKSLLGSETGILSQ